MVSKRVLFRLKTIIEMIPYYYLFEEYRLECNLCIRLK